MKIKKKRIALKLIIYTLLAIFAGVTCLISIWPFGMYISNARYGVYGCLDGASVVPDGSLIVTDRMAPVNKDSKIAIYGDFGNSRYPDGMNHVLVGYAGIDENSATLYIPDESSIDIQIEKAESVVWSVKYLGEVTYFIYRFRFILWGIWVAVLIIIISLETTAPIRRANKYKKELIKTFDFYGEKYAEEDKNIDY